MRNKTKYEYPYNLVADILGDDTIFTPPEDFKGSVEYTLYLLTENERRCIKRYYEDKLTYRDIGKEFGLSHERIRQIVVKALRKLRHPDKWKYISQGVRELIKNDKSLEKMGLSPRSYNLLKRNGITSMQEVYALGSEELKKIKHIGRYTFSEIVNKLRKCGYSIPSNGEWKPIDDKEE